LTRWLICLRRILLPLLGCGSDLLWQLCPSVLLSLLGSGSDRLWHRSLLLLPPPLLRQRTNHLWALLAYPS
jgi:hypothetical protein